ncbi:hypothetical protein O6H91_14G074000 [Diphasiastrum complanatum]|uniref:Uncharacterized protein n=1 Tax=Diphasiastrum complanatum TaxID=34168 RepID=A0ACC2BR57_DIPCM|nr:hypothetical protein O6H91_14G074000 [Diphasiastrum complanatum]
MAGNRHTIILMQPVSDRASCTYMDFDSVSQAINGICSLLERRLTSLNPRLRNITYDVDDLYQFIDGMADMSALVYDPSTHSYSPNDRQWIKQRAYQYLARYANDGKRRCAFQ